MPDAAGIRAGAAYVELSVRDHRLVRGLNAAAARLKAFGASITALGTRLAGLGAFLGTPLLAAVKTFADMGDHVAKAAARLGVTTEALSELRYATERSGGTAEDLEKSLRAMSKTVIEAARDSRDARRELQRLGLTVHDLSGLSPDQQLELIADRLAKIRNPAQRATIALGIFGKSGAKLLPLLAAGSQGIRELRNEARELGLSIATDDAQAAEAFVDALTNLWGSLKRVAFLVGASLAPALQRAAQGITTAGKLVGDWIQRNRQWVLIVGGVVAGLTAVGLALFALGPALSAIGAGIGLVVLAIKAAAAADQQRIAIAQQRLADKVAEMATKRQQVERERQPAADARADPGRRQPEFDLEGLDEAEAKTDVLGTFNALAVAGLGADSLAERTAKATEQIAKNTDKLVREAQHGGLVFA